MPRLKKFPDKLIKIVPKQIYPKTNLASKYSLFEITKISCLEKIITIIESKNVAEVKILNTKSYFFLKSSLSMIENA